MIRHTSRRSAALAAAAVAAGALAALAPVPAAHAAPATHVVPAAQAAAGEVPMPVTDPAFYAMESGTIASANGTEGGNSTRIRLATPAAIDPSWEHLRFAGGTDLDITVFAYTATGAYISPSTGWQSLTSGPYTYAVPAGTVSVAYVLKYHSETAIGPADRDPWLEISVVEGTEPVDDSHVFPYSDTGFTLVNHRGLAPGYPENTIVAYQNAVARGVDAIEIDLRPTADGQVIILHDDTVDRTTDGTGAASSLTLAQIKALDAGSYAGAEFAGQRIPTYEEALQVVQGTGVKLLLDMKSDAIVADVVALTEQYGMSDQVIVGPRTVQALTEFIALDPDLITLGFIGSLSDVDPFVAAGVDIIRLTPEWIAADVANPTCMLDYAARVAAYDAGERAHPGARSCEIERLRNLGVPVWTTTYDTGYAGMETVLRSGSVGLLSDLPDVLAQLLTDIETSRRTEAATRITTLLGDAAALPTGAAAVTTALHAADEYLVDTRIADACEALGGVHVALAQSGSPAEAIAPLDRDVARTESVLACSRFSSDEEPPVDVPEAPLPVLMALLGLATIGGLAALGSRRRRRGLAA